MPPAATLGDMTAHGTPLAPGPGSVNVFIGGKPAWRAGFGYAYMSACRCSKATCRRCDSNGKYKGFY